jgi:hypothetical protein
MQGSKRVWTLPHPCDAGVKEGLDPSKGMRWLGGGSQRGTQGAELFVGGGWECGELDAKAAAIMCLGTGTDAAVQGEGRCGRGHRVASRNSGLPLRNRAVA